MAVNRKSSTEERILRHPGEYDVEIPNVTLAQFVLDGMAKHGAGEVACIDFETGRKMTYSDVSQAVRNLAAGLQAVLDVKPGQMVAVALPNCLEYGIAVLAINLCGAITTLVNPAQTLPELQHNTRLTKPSLWIGTDSFQEQFQRLYPTSICTRSRPSYISLDAATGSIKTSWSELMKIGAAKGGKVRPIQTSSPLDLAAFVLFSSGTTGLPKGVVLTNRNYVVTRIQTSEMTKMLPRSVEDATLFFMPLYHAATLNGVFESFVRGLRFILMPKFSFDAMLRAIQNYKVNFLFVVPVLAVKMIKEPVEKRYDLSSLRLLRVGAAAARKETIDALAEKFGCIVVQMYGLTEATLCCHTNSLTHSRVGSIGVVMPFMESKIVDPETNVSLGPNEEGEICVRGPTIMKGYIGDEQATKNTVDADGWLHTGDVGYYDEDGFFFITDRRKELIKFKGLQVSPTELEQVLLNHPDVAEAAVSAIPDEDAGELPRAYVVRRPGSRLTEDQLAKFVADQVSAHKRLRGGIVFIDAVPRTATGKIMRRELTKIQIKSKL